MTHTFLLEGSKSNGEMIKKLSIAEVEVLPDIMEEQDILLYMDRLLQDFPHPASEEFNEVNEILYELTCRHGYTYRPPNEVMKEKITNYIKSFVDFSNNISFDEWTGIIGMLKLYDFYPIFVSRRNDNTLSENSLIHLAMFKRDFVDKDELVDENGLLIKK